ncbi:MAG: hypothetical protein JXB07_07650 [Anaerolineae bacterium]|nr:hypothetical protein [Anaerolineae bacterium]
MITTEGLVQPARCRRKRRSDQPEDHQQITGRSSEKARRESMPRRKRHGWPAPSTHTGDRGSPLLILGGPHAATRSACDWHGSRLDAAASGGAINQRITGRSPEDHRRNCS